MRTRPKPHQNASAFRGLVVAVLALGAWLEVSHAQNTYPEVELSWERSHRSLEEGFETHLRVHVDREPGRTVWYRVEAIHHGGATEDDYRAIVRGVIYADRRSDELHWLTVSDDLDDDCESVEFRLVPKNWPPGAGDEQAGVTASDRPLRIRIVDNDGVAVDCGWGNVGGGGDPPAPSGPPASEPPPEPEPDPEPEPQPPCPSRVAPYWHGTGGFAVRPLDGSQATVRLACGEADGLEDGAWYWLNTGTASAAAPLLRREADMDLTAPVLPAGVHAEEGPLGTLFSRGPLMGVVPRLEVQEKEEKEEKEK